MIERRALAAALGAALVVLGTVPAHAQQKTFYLDRIQISGAPDDGYTVFRPRLYKKTRFYGMVSLGYTLMPLRKETVTNDPTALGRMGDPVADELTAYLHAGVEIAGRVGITVSLPIGMWQYGHPTDGSVADGFTVDTADIYDLRLDARVPIIHTKDGKFHWGLGGAVWLPTGDRFGMTSDGQITGYPYTAFEYDFSKFFLALNIGPHFRPTRGTNGAQGTLFLASDLRWSLGGYVPLRDGKYQVGLELWGTTGITKEQKVGFDADTESKFFKKRNTDFEWLLQGRMAVDQERRWWAMAGVGTRTVPGYGAPDLRILASIGYWFPIKDTNPTAPAREWRPPPQVENESDRDHDGFPDAIDKCPDIPEDGKPPDPSDGCPAGADRDGDGIPDEMDKCPDIPEDKDGVEDEDGCPETDADNDGIPDQQDKCPTEPGPASKIAERNGCPQLTKLQSDGTIQLLEPIQFEFNKSTIKPVSYPILDEVVALMKSRPKIRVGVYGHTDSVGGDAYNLRLSKQRAAACLRYIVDKGGISGNRLESEGYGETKPVDTNDTPEGRAKNRRVDFKILGGD